MARFYLPRIDIEGRRGVIMGEELEHLRKVLRLGPGDYITVFDDKGWEHEAVIRSLSSHQGDLEILRSSQGLRESPLEVTLALGLTKGEKIDFVVEKATELGIQIIAPFVSTYTVPKLDEKKMIKRAERWQKIALSAAKQCGRTRPPKILPLCDFHALVKQPRPETLKLLFWENEAQQSLNQVRAIAHDIRSLLIVIGPEGGFNVQEAELAKSCGFRTVHLGRRVLRAETAAVAAASLAQFLWGDLG